MEHKNSRAEKLEKQVLALNKEKYGEVKPEQKDKTSIKDLEKQIARLEAKKTSAFENINSVK